MIPIAEIRAAAQRIAGKVHRTPMLSCRQLGDRIGAHLHLKCESFQKTGSFKPRGALNKVLSLSPMTFPHQVVRLLLIEQVYRALSVRAGLRYHRAP